MTEPPGLVKIIPAHEEREALLKATRVASLTEVAKLQLDDPPEATSYEEDSIERLFVTFQHVVESLKILGSSLESIADDEFDDEEARALVQLKDRDAHEYFVELVNSRFPSASQQLIQVLGQSNWNRYNYVQALRESAPEEPDAVVVDKTVSEFHDSGVGSSAPPQSVLPSDRPRVESIARSEYAATVISSRAEASHKRLPPLPETGRSGDAFECEVCNKTLHIKRTKEWKSVHHQVWCRFTHLTALQEACFRRHLRVHLYFRRMYLLRGPFQRSRSDDKPSVGKSRYH